MVLYRSTKKVHFADFILKLWSYPIHRVGVAIEGRGSASGSTVNGSASGRHPGIAAKVSGYKECVVGELKNCTWLTVFWGVFDI